MVICGILPGTRTWRCYGGERSAEEIDRDYIFKRLICTGRESWVRWAEQKQPTSPRSELYKMFSQAVGTQVFAWAIRRNLEVQKSNPSPCWCVERCVSIWVSLCNSCNGSHRAWIHLLRVPFSALKKRGDRCAIVETPNKWTCEREVLVSMYTVFDLGSVTIPKYNQTGIKTTET